MNSIVDAQASARKFLVGIGIVVAALSMLMYGQILTHRYITLDDLQLIFFNPATKGPTLTNIKTAFTTFDPELYIPLTILSYQLEFLVAGTQPAVTHAVNLLLHGMNAILVCSLTLALSRRKMVAAITALLFAVHPLHAEAVAWAAARKDLLSSLFFLSSCIAFLSWKESGKTFPILSFVLFFLGLLSKALVLPLPIVLLIFVWVRGEQFDRRTLLALVPFFGLSALFGIVGLFGKHDIVASLTPGATFLMAAKSTVHYLVSMFVPTSLVVMYSQSTPITLASSEFWIPVCVVLILCAVSVASIRRTRVILGSTLFFLLLLAPTFINFAKAGDVYFASDRYAYVPSIAVFFLIALGLDRMIRYRQTIGWQSNMRSTVNVLGGTTLIILALMSHAQAATWNDSISLFTHSVTHYPASSAAHLNLGVLHLESGDPTKAIEHFQKSAAIRPRSAALAGLASAYHALERNVEATETYRKATDFDPDDAEPHFGLANLHADMGNVPEAIKEYEASISIDPRYVAAYNNFGVLLMNIGDSDRAEAMLTKASSLNPAFGKTHFNLGKLYQSQRRNSEAIASFEKVLALDPSSTEAMINLAACHVLTKQPKEAFELLKRALKSEPDNADAKALLQEMIRLKMIGTER